MTRYFVTGTIPGRCKVQHVISARTRAEAVARFRRSHPTAIAISAREAREVYAGGGA